MTDSDFSDALFVLECGCVFDGCSGAAGMDRWWEGKPMRAHCSNHKTWTALLDVVSLQLNDGPREAT